jgi:hypothetical protein
MRRQEFFHLSVEPILFFITLTRGTMPIATAARNGLHDVTVMAPINNRSERATATIGDIFNGLLMD